MRIKTIKFDTLEVEIVSFVLTRLEYGNAMLGDIPENLLRNLLAVLMAPTSTRTDLPCLVHITSLFGLQWFHVAECIKFKLITLTYRCLHCTVPRFLSTHLTRVDAFPFCWHYRSFVIDHLFVRPTWLLTVGNVAFLVVAAKLWLSSLLSLWVFFIIRRFV